MHIAIVEDNRPLADGLAMAFQADGHGVDLIHDGDDAERFLSTEQVDLIILDIIYLASLDLRFLNRYDNKVIQHRC